jgi:hypothetical protein
MYTVGYNYFVQIRSDGLPNPFIGLQPTVYNTESIVPTAVNSARYYRHVDSDCPVRLEGDGDKVGRQETF